MDLSNGQIVPQSYGLCSNILPFPFSKLQAAVTIKSFTPVRHPRMTALEYQLPECACNQLFAPRYLLSLGI